MGSEQKLRLLRRDRYEKGNLYINNLDHTIDTTRLCQEFSKFGIITSVKIVLNEHGVSKGFGFVCFSSPKDATAAINKMNGKVVGSCRILVKLASESSLPGTSADNQLLENGKHEVKLYVKILDNTINVEHLRAEFARYGTITFAKVIMKGRRSGFGFICLSSPEEAANAIEGMNNRIVGTKPIYVELSHKNYYEESHLTTQLLANMHIQQTGKNDLNSTVNRSKCFSSVNTTSSWSDQALVGSRACTDTPYYYDAASCSSQTGAVRKDLACSITGNNMPENTQQTCFSGQRTMAETNYTSISNMHSSPSISAAAVEPAVHVQDKDLIDVLMLVANEEKQNLGIKLSPLVQRIYPDHVGTIMEMLLELNMSQLLEMLENYESFEAKVEEAMAVLNAIRTGLI